MSVPGKILPHTSVRWMFVVYVIQKNFHWKKFCSRMLGYFLSLILSLDLLVSVRDVFMSNLGKKSTLSWKILAREHCECSAQISRVSFKFFLSQLFYESEFKENWSLFQFANTEKQIIAPCKSTTEEVLFESSHHKILSSDLPCVASVSVWFRSKKRPRNAICLSLFFAPKPHGNACYAGYHRLES